MAIKGDLPFSDVGGNLFYGDPAQQYKSAYTSALNLNKANYQNILKGYQDTMAEQKHQQDNVVRGYDFLSNSVVNKLYGANQSNIQDINDKYRYDQGRATNQLVNRGLGNTTVQQSVQRGLGYDRAKAVTDSENRFANTIAGYESQIGLARQNYRGGAVRDNTALAGQQLNWMNSIQSPYPDANAYMKIAEMKAKAAQTYYPNFGSYGGGSGGGSTGTNYGGGGGRGGGRRQWNDPNAARREEIRQRNIRNEWDRQNQNYWDSWDVGDGGWSGGTTLYGTGTAPTYSFSQNGGVTNAAVTNPYAGYSMNGGGGYEQIGVDPARYGSGWSPWATTATPYGDYDGGLMQ
jgi:hypothetical protein